MVHNYRPVARVRVEGPNDDDAKLEFQEDKLAMLNITKDQLAQAYRAAGPNAPGPLSGHPRSRRWPR